MSVGNLTLISNKLTWYSRKYGSGLLEKTVLCYGQFCFVGPVTANQQK
jgi:hypothetical protein